MKNWDLKKQRNLKMTGLVLLPWYKEKSPKDTKSSQRMIIGMIFLQG